MQQWTCRLLSNHFLVFLAATHTGVFDRDRYYAGEERCRRSHPIGSFRDEARFEARGADSN